MFLCPSQFLFQPCRNYWNGYNMRMQMVYSRACQTSMIFKNMDILKSRVPFQIGNSCTIHSQHIHYFIFRKGWQTNAVLWTLYNQFMGTYISHLIKHPLSLPSLSENEIVDVLR